MNSKVIRAFFDFYVNTRKDRWGLKESGDQLVLPTDSKTLGKINTCIAVLRQVENIKDNSDTINLIVDLIGKERKESPASESWLYTLLNFPLKPFKDVPLLAYTLHAALTYSISSIKKENEFKDFKRSLSKQKSDLEKSIHDDKSHGVSSEIIAAKQRTLEEVKLKWAIIQGSIDYHLAYFQDIIKKRDPISNQLKEEKFSDFECNVIENKRALSLTQKLLDYDAKARKQICISPIKIIGNNSSKATKISTTASVMQSLPINEDQAHVEFQKSEVGISKIEPVRTISAAPSQTIKINHNPALYSTAVSRGEPISREEKAPSTNPQNPYYHLRKRNY